MTDLALQRCVSVPWRKEECVPLLEGHGRAELGLLVVVAQVRDLVQVMVSEFGCDEEEPRLEDVHGGGHGGRVEVLQLDLRHLMGKIQVQLLDEITPETA